MGIKEPSRGIHHPAVPANSELSPRGGTRRPPAALLPIDTSQLGTPPPSSNTQRSTLGRTPREINRADTYAHLTGTTTKTADLNALKQSAQERITLPGISGIPVNLLRNRDTAEAALRAAERVYDMSLRELGVDEATRQTQVTEFATRSKETIRNLFSGEQGTTPDGALVAGIQALQTAATLYSTLDEKKER